MTTIKRRSLLGSILVGPLVVGAKGLQAATSAPPPSRTEFMDIRALIGGDGDISAALRKTISLGKSAWIATGRYTVSGRIDQGDCTIKAAPGALIEASGEDRVIFQSSGSFTRLTAPIGNLVKGKSGIRLKKPHRIRPGDWIVVFNAADFSWHASRPYYRAGEWCQVVSATSRSIELAHPLRSSYAASDIQLFRVTLRRPALIGGRWQCGERELVRYTACTGRLIDVEHIDAASNTAVYIDRCVDADVHCRTGRNAGSGLDDYLICIGNSHAVRVTGERMYARRHPVAIGGGDLICGVPCRNCIVEGLTLENDMASNVMCADIHGNAENCSYANCTIFGGISIGGASPTFHNCKVYARRDGTAAEATELVGGTIDLTGIEVTSDATKVGGGRGVIDIGTQNGAFNKATRLDVTLNIFDFSVTAPSLARDEAIIRIRNSGSSVRLNVRAGRGKLRLNEPVQFLRTERSTGGDASSTIDITNISGLPPQSTLHYAVSDAYGGSKHKL